jgi:hypothetical protein
MQPADAGDFQPLGKPLRHRSEVRALAIREAVARGRLTAFETRNHGAAREGCMQERELQAAVATGLVTLKYSAAPPTDAGFSVFERAVGETFGEIQGTGYPRSSPYQLGVEEGKSRELHAQLAALVNLRSGAPVDTEKGLEDHLHWLSSYPMTAKKESLTAASDEEVKAYFKRAALGKVAFEEANAFEPRLALRKKHVLTLEKHRAKREFQFVG